MSVGRICNRSESIGAEAETVAVTSQRGEQMSTVGHPVTAAGSDRIPSEPPQVARPTSDALRAIGRTDLEAMFREVMRRRLRARRESIFRLVAETEEELRVIAEDRESEVEERAQEQNTARLLAQLDERGKRAIEEIDSALARIAAGAYGSCLACGHRITFARLNTLPAARLCTDCARDAEV